MEIRKIKCDFKGCDAECTEARYGAGFPGWGHIAGMVNSETGQELAHLCPEHLKQIFTSNIKG